MNDIIRGPGVVLAGAETDTAVRRAAEGSITKPLVGAVVVMAEDGVIEAAAEAMGGVAGDGVHEPAAAEGVAGATEHGLPEHPVAKVEPVARVKITAGVVSAETEVPGAGETASRPGKKCWQLPR